MNQPRVKTFYKHHCSPQGGDEFVSVGLMDLRDDFAMPRCFEVRITRGTCQGRGERPKLKKPREYTFSTLENAERAFQKCCDEAIRKGFRFAGRSA